MARTGKQMQSSAGSVGSSLGAQPRAAETSWGAACGACLPFLMLKTAHTNDSDEWTTASPNTGSSSWWSRWSPAASTTSRWSAVPEDDGGNGGGSDGGCVRGVSRADSRDKKGSLDSSASDMEDSRARTGSGSYFTGYDPGRASHNQIEDLKSVAVGGVPAKAGAQHASHDSQQASTAHTSTVQHVSSVQVVVRRSSSSVGQETHPDDPYSDYDTSDDEAERLHPTKSMIGHALKRLSGQSSNHSSVHEMD